MAKDPTNQKNSITFTTGTKLVGGTTKPCIKSSPHVLEFCKRNNTLEIFLVAPDTNTRPVVLTFDDTASGAAKIFAQHSTSPLTLNPGRTEKWVLKSNIAGLLSLPDFSDPDTAPNFVNIGRLFKFKFERCDEGDHNDVHVEC